MSGPLTSHEDRGTPTTPRGRKAIFDVARGLSVVSMVLFHLCYDLRYLQGVPLGFFRPPLQDVWRASTSWTFLFVAGCMCSFSRNGMRRALRYALVAVTVFVATSIASVDTPISFGIMFCMAASTLVDELLGRLGLSPRGVPAAIALLCLFVVLLHLPQGTIGMGAARLGVPRVLYATPCLAFLGLPGPGFASGDYYPLLPYCLMYLCGAAMGRSWEDHGHPRWFDAVSCRPLEGIGRHALPIYLLHQPVILGLLALVR